MEVYTRHESLPSDMSFIILDSSPETGLSPRSSMSPADDEPKLQNYVRGQKEQSVTRTVSGIPHYAYEENPTQLKKSDNLHTSFAELQLSSVQSPQPIFDAAQNQSVQAPNSAGAFRPIPQQPHSVVLQEHLPNQSPPHFQQQRRYQQNIQTTSDQTRWAIPGMRRSWYGETAASPQQNWQAIAAHQLHSQHAYHQHPYHTANPSPQSSHYHQERHSQQGRPQNQGTSFMQGRLAEGRSNQSFTSGQFKGPVAYVTPSSIGRQAARTPTSQVAVPTTPHKTKNELALAEHQRQQPQKKSKLLQMQASPKHQPAEDIDRTVQVSGGDVAMNEELMKLYFENTRSSGGGPIFRTEVKEDAKVTLITFEEQTAAERVLNRSHTVSNTKLSVTPYKPKDATACTKIRVKGLTSKVSEQLLQLYFEKWGQTDVVDVHMFAHIGEAVVEFDNPAALQTVLAQSHTVGGRSVTVTPEITHKATPASPATSITSSTPAGGTQGHPMPTPQTYTVEVQGLAPVTTKDTVMWYFENKRRSGGGVIDDLQYVEGSGVASVTFRDAEAMTRVLQQQHRIDNKILRVSRALPQQSSRSAGSAGTAAVSASTGLTTVSVRGLPSSTSTDALMCYFENKRSGGGDVKEIHLDKRSGVFFVTFEEQEVAARVAARSHIFQDQTMDVRLEEPPQPYTDRILLTNLPAVRTTDELKYFVEAKTQVSVSSILFGDSGDVAVIMFESHIDHKEVQAALTRKPFKEHTLSVDSILQSRTILVKNLPKHPPVSKDTLTLYFENARRYQGGEVTGVEMNTEGQYALVTFADPEVAVRVSAAAQELKLHSSVLAVSLYLECLGVSGGSTELTASLPPQRPLSESHYQKISHLHNLPGAMQDLQDSLANRHARLELGAGCGFVVCTLTQEVDNVRQLARSWEDDVDRILDIHLQPIFIHQLEVTPEVFTHAEGHAKQKVTGDSGVNLSYDAGKELLTVVYKGQQKRDIFEEIVDIVTTVQSEVERRKQEKTDKIPLSKEKLQLLKTHKTVHDVKEKYPKLEINFSENNEYVELKGVTEEIQDVKLTLLQAVSNIISLHYTWGSDLHKQLLELPVARMTVESLCIERGPDEVIEFTPDGFQVHSFDAERAEMVQTIAIQAVQKRVIRFDENSRHAIKCQEWSEMKYSVVINNEQLVVMDETTEALTLVGVGPSVHKEYKRLLDFLEKNGVKQQALQLPRALHELFRPYFLDRVLDMSLKQDDFVFDPDNDQIIISGNKLCLDTAEGILHTFNQEITMKKVTYTEPSMEEYLQTPAWRRKRKDMAVSDKCLVLDPEELPDMYQEEAGVKKKDCFLSLPVISFDGGAMASGGVSVEQAQGASTALFDVREARRRMKVSRLPAAPPKPQVPVRPRIFLSSMSDITKEEHHVLVNSSNPALSLKDGQVSRDLLRVGGMEIQEECKAKYPSGIKMGELAVTKGGKLMCKKIFHCTLPKEKDTAKIRKVVKDAVKKCLKMADKLKLNSIGFPALGTGTLAYPAAVVAKALYEVTLDYGLKHPNTIISDVFFILHKKDTALTEVFKEADADYRRMLSESHSQTLEEELGSSESTHGTQRYLFFENTRGRVVKLLVGMNQTAVDKADSELLQCYRDSVVTVPEDDLNLSQWDELSKNNLINACRIAKVDVTLNFDLGRLTLHGFLEKVDKIPKHSIIKEAEKGVKELKHAELISQQVQWSSIEVEQGGTSLLPYDKRNNYRIEMDYKEGKPRSMIDEFVDGVRLAYTIDFTTMEEIPEDPEEAAKPRPTVIRQNKIRGAEVQPPKTWSSMQGMVDPVPLSPSSPEYQGVAETFMQSLQRPATKIQKIERIQNPTLYKQYQALKQEMETSMPPNKPCELTKLWHGTKSEAVDGIIRYGFNRSFNNLEKSAWGQGAYFATTAAYSSRDEYAKADVSQQRHMFRCSVLVGEYTKGDQSMRSPPEKTPGGKRYNSTVDDVNSPTIFVTYNDVQAYPEYRIVFKDQ
ncbi:uncharacterized protein LOC143293737 [Babylonia areolata]|uniref:uncharacterized protein LOC143293737 n=1 Tax=Babylonia areolata TaxID=304850 RepID=UPI003FD3AA55